MPQRGPQTAFLATTADVAIYGGARGGGKSWASIAEAVRFRDVPGFTAAIFRKTTPMIEASGGLWQKARPVFSALGAKIREKPTYDAVFPSGATIKCAHLENDKALQNWQGAELALIIFEEMTHFERYAFLSMLMCLRSTCGVRPYFRGTCNPDPDSFVYDMVEWYLDEEGYADESKSGAVRYFAIDNDQFVWGDSVGEVAEKVSHLLIDGVTIDDLVLSFTFIPAKLDDNPALNEEDPGYRAKLNTQSEAMRKRMAGGNWKVRERAGDFFKGGWFEIVDDWPREMVPYRYWDLAGSARRRSDFTAGAKGVAKDGRLWLIDMANERNTPHGTEQLIKGRALGDGPSVRVFLEQEIGAGAAIAVDQFQRYVLPGYSVEGVPVRGTGAKIERARPLSSAAQAGNVLLVRGAWNSAFIKQAERFPEGKHDDMVDAASGLHHQLFFGGTWYGRVG